MVKKKALGKGLDVLLADADIETSHEGTKKLALSEIKPNPNQPRKSFNQNALEELAASIKQDGLLSPIIVREMVDYYEIVAGERRFQASKIAGLKEVDVRIMEFSDTEALRIALIENVQRDDLNPIEQAKAYKALMQETGVTQAELAKELSKSRSNIANALRLLDLPENIQNNILDGKITPGHARAILSVKDAEKRQVLANKIVSEQISVRAAEKLAKDYNAPNMRIQSPSSPSNSTQYKHIQESLANCLNTKVKLSFSGEKKFIKIEFETLSELKKIQSIIES